MGFKMKKFSGFKSPAKVSDTEVIDAQKRLDEIELKFKEPGWTKVAGKLHDPLGVMGGKKKEGEAKKKAGGAGDVDPKTVASLMDAFSKSTAGGAGGAMGG